MNNKELIELVDAVNSINADLYSQCTTVNKRGKNETDPWIEVEIRYGCGTAIVEFLEQRFYNSNEDRRKFDEKKNEYEPFEPSLCREINKFIGKLQQIKL